jgi:hypothetical protein
MEVQTFSPNDQKSYRGLFFEECRAKAWAEACHAVWISKQPDGGGVEYKKLQEEDRKFDE